MYAEVRKDGKWEKVGPIFPNNYADLKALQAAEEQFSSGKWHDFYETEDEGLHELHWSRMAYGELTDEPYKERNYHLFSVLADVRGSGIAISRPRGVPEDASPEYKKIARFGEKHSDWHSHSYFTLQELLNFDWSSVAYYGEVPYEDPEYQKIFHAWIKLGDHARNMPTPPVRNVTYRELLADAPILRDGSQPDRGFLTVTLPLLEKLGEPNDVRIVFFFDN
jgi:hypothetical protein